MRKLHRTAGYIIQEPGFEGLEIMKTDRAWWSNSSKVLAIITARWQGQNLRRCLATSGVTKKQWRHFVFVHPHFLKAFREVIWIRRRVEAKLPLLPGYPPEPEPPLYSGLEREPDLLLVIPA